MTDHQELINEARGLALDLNDATNRRTVALIERLAAALASVPGSLPAPREKTET